LAIPVAGAISAALGTRGFLIVLALNVVSVVTIAYGVYDRHQRERQASRHAVRAHLRALGNEQARTFLPAWIAINAVVGAWITVGLLALTYPDRNADSRFPHQLLYGGFTQVGASLAVGGFGVLFLVGMGLWSTIVTRLRRSLTMLIGLAGLAVSMIALAMINGIGGDLTDLAPYSHTRLALLLVVTSLGLLILSGFAPAALAQIAATTDREPEYSGAVLGLYAFGLGVGQLLGAVLGGMAVDHFGTYGLIGFSGLLGVIALGSVLAFRLRGFDEPDPPAALPAFLAETRPV
jgi:MFS family permease